MKNRLFTSESVTEGHPDKIADQISDAILDSLLSQDAKSRVAVETLITTGQVHVAGEVTTNGYADVMNIVRDTVLEIGYNSSDKGFDGNSCGVSISIGQQSQDIAQGVNDAFESRVSSSVDPLDLQGAGDQGLMFGYACNETPELMPLPISLAHKLAQQLTKVRKDGTLEYLRPDGKTQVTIEYQGDKPVALNTIVISSQHAPDVDLEKKLAPEVKKFVIDPILKELNIDTKNVIGPNYTAQQAQIELYKGDEFITLLRSERRQYNVRTMDMTEAAIDGALHRDLYVSLGEPLAGQAWAVRLYVKPFVRCIWLGALMIALGGLIAAADKRYRRRLGSKKAAVAIAGSALDSAVLSKVAQ